MTKKKKHAVSLSADNDQRVRLREIEETLSSWAFTGRLWDKDDPYVTELLKERDELFYQVNPHLTGLSFADMSEEDWEKIDEKHQEELNKETPYEEDDDESD